jgi:ribosome-binding factor A
MRHRRHRTGGGHPPFVDPAFAETLAGHKDNYRKDRKHHYKALQLCRQVHRALTIELSGHRHALLRDLYVVDVTPAPDATHLLVHVALPPYAPLPEALAALARATPRLRVAVAQAITRKRAPELSFIPAAADAGEVAP